MRNIHYDEAKVLECVRTGIGATYAEIRRLLNWDRERMTRALSALGTDDMVEIKLHQGEIYFAITKYGEDCYQRWAEIPF